LKIHGAMVSLQFTQVPHPGRNRWKSPGNPNRFVAEIMGGLGRYLWSKMKVPPGNITQNPTNFIQLVSIPLLDKMTTTGFKHPVAHVFQGWIP